jgi:hypothetical protein
MRRAVGIALAAKPERVTGLRSVTAETAQPSRSKDGCEKKYGGRMMQGQVGECVSTLYLCRMEEKMTVPPCV